MASNPDVQIGNLGTGDAPLSYTVAGSQEFRLLAANATFDGSAAGGSWLPTLELISDSGQIVARSPVATAVAAGGAAEVSWFRGLRKYLFNQVPVTPSGPCPPTGHGGFALRIGTTAPDNFVSKNGLGGSGDTDYFLTVNVFINGITTAPHSDVFSVGGFMSVAGDRHDDAIVFWGGAAWQLQWGDGSITVTWPADCHYHLVEQRLKYNSSVAFPQITHQLWIDGVDQGTITYGNNNGPTAFPDGPYLGNDPGSPDSIAYYFADLKFGTTRGGSQLFADNFAGGLAAWTQTGAVSTVPSP